MRQGLVLASASARRRQLLESAGIDFEVLPSDIPEQQHPGEPAEDFAVRMATAKAAQVRRRLLASGDERPVLGADTIVVLDGQTLGKPTDRANARWMLQSLAGRSHTVVTAYCLLAEVCNVTETTQTEVTFMPLTDHEIERYLDRAHWQDKAGGYAVQEHAAYMVRTIRGSYTNVVGLPLGETIALLRRSGALP